MGAEGGGKKSHSKLSPMPISRNKDFNTEESKRAAENEHIVVTDGFRANEDFVSPMLRDDHMY